MQYNVIGLMSGSSLDGLDIAFVHFEENAGNWSFEILETACLPYASSWKQKLADLTHLSAKDFLLLHTEYGHWIGKSVNHFVEEKELAYRVQLIASHGHTAFHIPSRQMTAQIGDGAAIAAETGIRTITDFRSSDIALGGQGAPIVPIGEKLLFPDVDFFLNIGGIANLSANSDPGIGFDVCPANRILNALSAELEKGFDENGQMATFGKTNEALLKALNSFDYYKKPYPKSLSNDFGLYEILPLIEKANLSTADSLNTYIHLIVEQIAVSLRTILKDLPPKEIRTLFITGGGAHNGFLIKTLQEKISPMGITCTIPDEQLINYKEALIIALMGALRWREDVNVLSSVTGASKDSVNGAIWSA